MFISVLASNQVGCGGFFTSLLSGCEFLPAQTISFSRPSLMKPWMLRARKVSPSLWAYPSADWRLNGIAHSPLLRWKKMLRFSFVLWIPFYCSFDIDCWTRVFSREFLQRRNQHFWRDEWSRSETSFEKQGVLAIDSLVTTCTCFAYMYIYVMYKYLYMLGLIFTSCWHALKVTGHKVETSNPTGFLEKQIKNSTF